MASDYRNYECRLYSRSSLTRFSYYERGVTSIGLQLEHHLVILELSQKAAELYAKKTAEQKRLIISKLFEKLTIKGGSLSVKYSKFSHAIADKVQKTHKLMEAQK